MKTLFSLLALGAGLRCQPTPPRDNLDLYYLVFLRPIADRKPLPKAEAERIQQAHMANIRKMVQDQILVAAGPMEASPSISGIFFFKAASLEQAQNIAAQDPTVAEKRNAADVHPWWGPKGVGAPYFQWKKEHPDAPDQMRTFQFCLLRKGPAWTGDRTAENEQARAGHFEFIERTHREGKLVAAGPFDDDGDLRGLYIFQMASIEEARKLVEEDPAVKTGRFRSELHKWWSADHVFPQ